MASFSIPDRATDPLELMNAVMVFDDPPPRDKRWEVRIAALCERVVARNAELKRETEAHGLTAGVAAALNVEVERLREELRKARERIKRAQFTKADFDVETEQLVTGTAARAAGGEK